MGITQITKKSIEWEGCDDESAACVDAGVVAVMRTILDGLERAPFYGHPTRVHGETKDTHPAVARSPINA